MGRLDALRAQLTRQAAGGRRRLARRPPWRGRPGRWILPPRPSPGRGRSLAAAATAALLLGCESDSGSVTARGDSLAHARQDSIVRSQPGYVIDSALSIEEALRRFRAGLTDTPIALTGGAPSREALIARFARAVERGDSLALRHMSMTRAEFAFLVYPSSPHARPPYRQQPEIAWLLLTEPGDKGLRRLLQRRAGKPLSLVGHQCPRPPDVEGENRLWRGCAIRRIRSPGDTVSERLFGAIIERSGRFKFYSYGNEL